ncbi:MAG: alpha/beta hydrolase [Propionibacteriales bacterium]|nr:alpha/beta hydrolase [Propionibacteriales bacterium]
MTSIHRAVLSALAAGALIASTVAVSSSADAYGGRKNEPGPVSIPQRYLDQKIDWQTCSFDGTIKSYLPDAPDTNCATITVPMDWQNPDDHPDIKLAIAMSKATGTSRGVMLTNPGGPGGAGLTMSASLAISKPQMFADYDLVGFDPRGFGKSEQLRCPIDSAELEALPTTPDYRERTDQTRKVEVAEAKAFAGACSSTEFSQFVSTQQTVYDMDFLRALSGSAKTNFIGYSYGTWMGTWYADTYPERVDRFVLDSNMNWVGDMQDNAESDSYSFQRRRDDMFFPWVARNDAKYTLGDSAAKVEQRYEEIRAKLVERTKAGGEGSTGVDLDLAVLSPIYSNSRFALAADVIVAMEKIAFGGELTPEQEELINSLDDQVADMAPQAKLAAAREALAPQDAEVDLGAIGTVVRCNDTPYSTNIQSYLDKADADAKKYSYIGYLNTVPMCAFWPYKQRARLVDLQDTPKMLMVQSEGDPATATEGALESHRSTQRRTTFVGVTEEGQHGIYIDGPSPCVETIGDAFVFEGKLPEDMTMCATTPLPGDDKVYPLAGPLDRYQPKPQADLRRAQRAAVKENKLLAEARQESVRLF